MKHIEPPGRKRVSFDVTINAGKFCLANLDSLIKANINSSTVNIDFQMNSLSLGEVSNNLENVECPAVSTRGSDVALEMAGLYSSKLSSAYRLHSIIACLILLTILALCVFLTISVTTSEDKICIKLTGSFYSMGTTYDVIEEAGSDVTESIPPTSYLERRLPDCYIIGVRETGGRVLAKYLKAHPQIAVYEGPETDFFRKDKAYTAGIDWYLNQMPLVSPKQILIEETTDYLIEDKVSQRIQTLCPKCRFIVVVSSPVDRVIRDYNYIRDYAWHNPSMSFQFPELNSDLQSLLITSQGDLNFAYAGFYRSKYSKFIPSWLQKFPREQFYFMDFGDIAQKNPVYTLRGIESFLGLEAHFAEDEFYIETTSSRWCHVSGCFYNQTVDSSASLDADAMSKIKAFFRPYNEEFFNMTGVRFDWE